MAGWIRWAWKEGAQEAAVWLFQSYLGAPIWAAIITAFTFLSGWVTPVPLPYLIASSALVFCTVTFALVTILFWREWNRVENRFYFDYLVHRHDVDFIDGQLVLKSIQIGLTLQNSAPFPIYFNVDEIRTSCGRRINPDPHRPVTRGKVVGGRPIQYLDARIDLGNIPIRVGSMIDGTLLFKISYGRTKKYRYQLEGDLVLHFYPNPADPGQLGRIWSYRSEGT